MTLLLNLLGLLLILAINLIGILSSGLLAAKRTAENEEPDSRTDSTERKTHS